MEWYRDTLTLFGHIGIPRFYQAKSFHERIDPLLLMMVKECRSLQTLVSIIIHFSKKIFKKIIERNNKILRIRRGPIGIVELLAYTRTYSQALKIYSNVNQHLCQGREFFKQYVIPTCARQLRYVTIQEFPARIPLDV